MDYVSWCIIRVRWILRGMIREAAGALDPAAPLEISGFYLGASHKKVKRVVSMC